jgi:hypothetical protein
MGRNKLGEAYSTVDAVSGPSAIPNAPVESVVPTSGRALVVWHASVINRVEVNPLSGVEGATPGY